MDRTKGPIATRKMHRIKQAAPTCLIKCSIIFNDSHFDWYYRAPYHTKFRFFYDKFFKSPANDEMRIANINVFKNRIKLVTDFWQPHFAFIYDTKMYHVCKNYNELVYSALESTLSKNINIATPLIDIIFEYAKLATKPETCKLDYYAQSSMTSLLSNSIVNVIYNDEFICAISQKITSIQREWFNPAPKQTAFDLVIDLDIKVC